jgi:site-specific DNA recombinase
LRGLYNAVADGLRTPGLQQELLALESRQSALTASIAVTPPSPPRFHPRLADMYRHQVANLHRALSDPEARTEAAEILRGLIDRITTRGDNDGHLVVLAGDIVKLLSLPGARFQLRSRVR